jgi:myo-inositol 2-dehydrogenase / D-chiro-inositol 1-dehydrogenase
MPFPTRRSALAAGALLGLPASVYRNALLAADPPSERVRTASIGVGNQGGEKNNLKYFAKNTVAVCDVDKNYLAAAGAFVEKAAGTKPAAYSDFRKLLDAKDIDAVVVTVPDHWHAIMTIHACRAGKDVYVEKPLSLTVREGRRMVDAARKHGRVVTTGSMQRSGKEFVTACELVRGGAVGTVHTIKVGLPKPNWVDRAKSPIPDAAPPAELDYDAWLGPAPDRAYNKYRVHYLFRFFWDYSGGQQTNFGAHHLDIAQWGMGMDASGPVAVEGTAKFHPQGWYETPDWTEIVYTYATGAKMVCGQGQPGGTTFVGDKGTIYVTRGKLTGTPTAVLNGAATANFGNMNANHIDNFLGCVKSRKTPAADVEVGHRSATVCHLGNIAVRTGKKIVWDPAKEEIVGDAEAAKWLDKEYRKKWAI